MFFKAKQPAQWISSISFYWSAEPFVKFWPDFLLQQCLLFAKQSAFAEHFKKFNICWQKLEGDTKLWNKYYEQRYKAFALTQNIWSSWMKCYLVSYVTYCLSVFGLSLKLFGCVLIRHVVAIQVVLQVPRKDNQLCRITISSSRTYKTDHIWQTEECRWKGLRLIAANWTKVDIQLPSKWLCLTADFTIERFLGCMAFRLLKHSIGLARCALCSDKLITTK